MVAGHWPIFEHLYQRSLPTEELLDSQMKVFYCRNKADLQAGKFTARSLFFFRFSEGSTLAHVLARCKDARNKGSSHSPSCTSLVPLPSHTFSHTCGHLHVSHVLLSGLRKRNTAHSLAGKCKTEQGIYFTFQACIVRSSHNTFCLEDTQKYKFNNIKANVQRDIFY